MLLPRHCVLSICLALVLAGGTAEAETIVGKSIRYYSIGGRTAAEIDRELAKHGPMAKSTGARHPGTTEIRFGGEISNIEEGGRCRVRDVKVTAYAKITLPRWKNRATANREMALLWDTLSADIKRHEERHAEIARNHARTLEARLSGLPSATTCAKLKQEIARVTDRSSAEHDADQARFDRVEAINFERRLTRLLYHRASRNGK